MMPHTSSHHFNKKKSFSKRQVQTKIQQKKDDEIS
jgi:hypothetical protein